MWDRGASQDALREGLGQRGGGSENGPPERQQAMVAGHGVGAPMVDRLNPGGEQPFSSIRSPAPPTRRTSTPTGSRSPGSCASPGAPPAVRRTYCEDWDDVLPHVLAESSGKINRPRRHRSYPRGQARPPQQLPRPIVKDARLRTPWTPCDRAHPAWLTGYRRGCPTPVVGREQRVHGRLSAGICCDARAVSAP